MLKNSRATVKSVLVLRPVSSSWVLRLVLCRRGRGLGKVVMLTLKLKPLVTSCISLAVPVRLLGRCR